MKLLDNEGMTHLIHKEESEYWVLSECFKVDFKNKSATGKTLADMGPYKTLDDAIASVKVFDPNVKVIDGSSPVSIINKEDTKMLAAPNDKPKTKSKKKPKNRR